MLVAGRKKKAAPPPPPVLKSASSVNDIQQPSPVVASPPVEVNMQVVSVEKSRPVDDRTTQSQPPVETEPVKMIEVREIQEVESTTGKSENSPMRNSKLRKNNLKLIFKPFYDYAQLSPFKGKKYKSSGNLPLTLGNLYREELNCNKSEMVEEPELTVKSNSATNIKHVSASDFSFTDDENNAFSTEILSCQVSEEKPYDENLLKVKAMNHNCNNKEPFNAKLSIFKARSNGNIVSDKCDAEWHSFLTKLDQILDNRVGEFV